MKKTRIYLILSLLFFSPALSKKPYLFVVGTKKLAALLRVVFAQNGMLEGKVLTQKIECLDSLINKAKKQSLAVGEKVVIKKVASLVNFLREMEVWNKKELLLLLFRQK